MSTEEAERARALADMLAAMVSMVEVLGFPASTPVCLLLKAAITIDAAKDAIRNWEQGLTGETRPATEGEKVHG